MNTYRKIAISVGVLFIVATVIGVLGNVVFLNPVLDAPDYLVRMSANENHVILGGLLVFFSALACAGIAIWLYPVLRKHHEAFALGSVAFRIVESMLYILGVVGLLSLLALSQEYVKAGASNASLFQVSGALLLAIKEWAGQLGVIAFTLGALMYYFVFYPIETRSSMAVRLGSSGSSILACSRLVDGIRPDDSFFDGLHSPAASHSRAGNGSCGMADREGIQSIRSRFSVCESSDELSL